MKTALITGITGQDGVLLARSLLADCVRVVGLVREQATPWSVDAIGDHLGASVEVLRRDIACVDDAMTILDTVKPDQIFNLAAQSSVASANADVIQTINTNATVPVIWLEALRARSSGCRFLQASSGEIFDPSPGLKNTESAVGPVNVYGATKAFAQQLCEIYARSFGVYACSAILFAHESPLRKETFLTRKVTRGLARIKAGLQPDLSLGNLEARRDWGAARDYVEGMRLAISAEVPCSYVFATGEVRSVRDFVNAAAAALEMPLVWDGAGDQEVAKHGPDGPIVVKIDAQFYRPVDPGTIAGDPTKAEQALGWHRKYTFNDIVAEMAKADLLEAYAEASGAVGSQR